MKILLVVGARPNFIKITQFKTNARLFSNLDIRIVHTGQHFDEKMAGVFFKQFDLFPDFYLNISGTSPNHQIAEIMIGLEKLIQEQFKPDLMLVVGDVNSTLAASITANKMNIKLGHIEAGLRSYDKTMPEEYNRLLTDQLSNMHFVTEQSGLDHLVSEGYSKDSIYFVGNTMLDTLVANESQIEASDILKKLQIDVDPFVLMTIHRPGNVDQKEGLEKLLHLITHVSKTKKIVFPIHPRTILRLKEYKLYDSFVENKNLILCDPLDYFSFQKLIKNCFYILTDSGGIQEESTFRKKPCLTIRPNTERPSTVEIGSNTLVDFDFEKLKKYIDQIETNQYKQGNIPPLWDGKSSHRILEIIQGLVL